MDNPAYISTVRRIGFLACCLIVFEGQPAAADKGTISIVVENDVLSETDQNYTNGLLISYLTPKGAVPDLLKKSIGRVPDWLGADHHVHAGFSLGHSIFTPDDIQSVPPSPDQHPYAGWLYLSLARVAEHEASGVLDMVALDLGVVGPSAGGEFVQRNFHELIDTNDPLGWDYQLKDEFGVNLWFQRIWRPDAVTVNGNESMQADIMPSVGFSVGNVMTQANVGLVARLGKDLGRDYVPPRIRPSLAGASYFEEGSGFNWYLFAGIGGRAIARNIFLDGNTWVDSASVDRRPWVGEAQAGLVLQYEQVQISYTYIVRSEEFDGQRAPHEFAAVSISTKW